MNFNPSDAFALPRRCSKCGGGNDRPAQKYCAECHAAYQRDYRKRSSISRGTVESPKNTTPGFLYIVQEVGGQMAKVGVASDIAARIRSLQNGNGRRLSAHRVWPMERGNAHDLERFVLNFFSDRAGCGEWLNVPAGEVACFVDNCLAEPSSRLGQIDIPYEAA